MKKFNDLEQAYKKSQEDKKAKIRLEPNRFKRFWKWVWFLLSFPFIWIWVNIRDWRTAIIFIIVFLIVSSEVWLMYLLYFITGNAWFLGIGSACWIFWLGPGTPFLPLCIGITIGIKAFFNKIKERRHEKQSQK